MQVIESSTAYFGHAVYGHSKLIIEPRTQIPHNGHFAFIAIPYPDSVNSSLFQYIDVVMLLQQIRFCRH